MKSLLLSCVLVLAARAGLADSTLFTNAQSIAVTNASAPSAAAPYPSTIAVSGLESHAVVKVTVTLHGLSHTYPDDLDVLLVGPRGQQVMLMSDAGGDVPAGDLTLTFDNASPSVVPDSGGLSGGSFRPHNYGVLPDVLAPPAPTSPYGTSLAVFNGTDPNGTWSLYVMDDTPEDVGVLAGGWSLSVETETRPRIESLERQGSLLRFRFTGEPPNDYFVEFSESLPTTNWLCLTNYRAKIQTIEAVVTDSLTNCPVRFYRIRKQDCLCD